VIKYFNKGALCLLMLCCVPSLSFAHSTECLPEGEIEPPSAEYPFKSKYVKIKGHKIHYVEEGRGKPIIFVHGNPTWSYIWRNVLKGVAENTNRRVIALDLLGMGKSDKPNLNYTPQLHRKVLKRFIRKLGLRDVILVGHDWGGPIMTGYAVKNSWNVEGLIFVDSFAWKMEYSDFGFIEPIMRLSRTPEGQDLLLNDPSWFAENLIKPGVLNQDFFTDEILNNYLEPFKQPGSRTAMAKFPRLIPIIDDPDSLPVSLRYFDHIEKNLWSLSHTPLVWIKGTPGSLLSAESFDKFEKLREQLPQAEVLEFGPGIHPLMEDNPKKIVELISDWVSYNGLNGRHRHYKNYYR